MADLSTGQVTVTFKADIADIRRALTEMKGQLSGIGVQAKVAGREITQGLDQARGATENLTQSTRQAQSQLSAFARGFATGALVTAFAALSKAVGDYVDQLREMSQVAKRTYQDVAQVSGLLSAGRSVGMTGSSVTAGINALGAKANQELREGEGELTRLLEANNMKLTDQAGKLKSVNDLLLDAAHLVRNAGSEYDKIDIARIFGLTEDWVKLLEKGPNALRTSQEEASRLGGEFDRSLAQKAKEFDEAWNRAWENFKEKAKAAIMDAGRGLVDLAKLAGSLGFGRGGIPARTDAPPAAPGSALSTLFGTPDVPGESAREGRRASAMGGLPFTFGGGATRTVIPTDKGGGGTERADAVERYIENLERSRAVLQQEVDLWGRAQTEIEQAKALEIARAAAKREGRDLTAEETAKVKEQGAAIGALRDKMDQLRDTQRSLVDLGRTFADAISDWAINGTKARDVFANLAKSIANMALQATLMGQGPLAGLFGTRTTNGNMGGLFGMLTKGVGGLFGGSIGPGTSGFYATGTSSAPGGWSIVGENGPEAVRLSGGAEVASASRTREMMSGGPSINVVTNIAAGVTGQDVMTAIATLERRIPQIVSGAMARGAI